MSYMSTPIAYTVLGVDVFTGVWSSSSSSSPLIQAACVQSVRGNRPANEENISTESCSTDDGLHGEGVKSVCVCECECYAMARNLYCRYVMPTKREHLYGQEWHTRDTRNIMTARSVLEARGCGKKG